MHDFRSYADADPAERSTRVKVERVEVAEAGDLLLVRVLGSHFLWKMVRRMVGVMAEVGRGGLSRGRRRALPARAVRACRRSSPRRPPGSSSSGSSTRAIRRRGRLRPVLNL